MSSCSGSPTAQQQSIQQLVAYAVKCVQPGFAYFKEKFDGELHPLVNCFKAPRMFSPIKMSEMQVDSLHVDELASFPFLNEPTILTNLKSELHVYVAAVEDISPDIDILQWWKNHQNDLPRWSAAFKSLSQSYWSNQVLLHLNGYFPSSELVSMSTVKFVRRLH